MSTIDRATAQRFADGEGPEDFASVQTVWAYLNSWERVSYKIMPRQRVLAASPFVAFPTLVWTEGQAGKEFTAAADAYEARYGA